MNPKIFILAAGRLLSQIGNGFTLFYAPIFFVNEVGISATLVGIALGSGSVSGILGRFIGGTLTDSPPFSNQNDLKNNNLFDYIIKIGWGRRRTLLLSALVSALADVVLVITNDFPTLVLGNLLMGFGIALYWPATEAVVADLTTAENRNEAFAIARLSDNIGLGIGVVLGGILIASGGNYRYLFFWDGITFLLFFFLIYIAIPETYQYHEKKHLTKQGWQIAFSDRRLMTYCIVNILFTTYLAQVQSTLPLYLKNFVSQVGFSATIISALFTWHIVFAALCQLPIARFLNRFSRINALKLSLLLWGIGFACVWIAGISLKQPLIWSIFALATLSLGMVSYTPSASSLVVELAPPSLRGIYLSVNSQCWAIGYLIGPPLGGWALDQDVPMAHFFWLILSFSIIIGWLILQILKSLIQNYSEIE
jgi:MFS family permease